jgi:hypothetical protein
MPIDPSLITDTMARWQVPQIAIPDPLAAYSKLQTLKSGIVQQQIQQQQLQTGRLELQQKQKAIADQEALDNAFKTGMTPDADGNLTLSPTILSNLAAGGHGSAIPGLTKTFADANEATAKLKKTQMEQKTATDDYVASHLQVIADGKYNPALATATIGKAVRDGVLPAPQAAQIASQIQQNPTPEGVQAIIDPLLAQSLKMREQRTKEQTAGAAVTRAGAAQSEAETATEKERVAKVNTALQAAGAATDQPSLEAARAAAIAAKATPEEAGRIPLKWSPENMAAFNRAQMTAEQRATQDRETARDVATEADRKVTQAQNARRIAIEGQNAGINAQKFAMEFGGDAVKGWAKQIADNPDTANQVPPALRTPVMQAYTAATGQPFPKPLTGTAVDQERAARNSLDAVAQIKEALSDPEIQKRVGPILGRLGNAEQTAGTALGLTPAQEAKAQQLRTNMRYLVFQEGKAMLGGRMPAQLFQQLEQSSPNVAMDAGTLNGALAGVSDGANRVLDQTHKQRFGENAVRPGSTAAPAPAAGRITVKAGDGSTHPFNSEAEARAFESLVKSAGGTTTRQ